MGKLQQVSYRLDGLLVTQPCQSTDGTSGADYNQEKSPTGLILLDPQTGWDGAQPLCRLSDIPVPTHSISKI